MLLKNRSGYINVHLEDISRFTSTLAPGLPGGSLSLRSRRRADKRQSPREAAGLDAVTVFSGQNPRTGAELCPPALMARCGFEQLRQESPTGGGSASRHSSVPRE
jgi:hypothetical protein